jgi:hypothetical protein
MTSRYFEHFAKKWNTLFVPVAFDPVAWVKGRSEWSLAKRRGYVETILKQLGPGVPTWANSFKSMVKSG